MGKQAFDTDRRAISRYLWRTWSPAWSFTDEEFATAAAAWDNPDWPSITVHAYLHRWTDTPGDPAYEDLERKLAAKPPITVPTIVLHGADDRDNLPATTAGRDTFFTGGYQRKLLPGVGHFIPREEPAATTEAILQLVQAPASQLPT